VPAKVRNRIVEFCVNSKRIGRVSPHHGITIVLALAFQGCASRIAVFNGFAEHGKNDGGLSRPITLEVSNSPRSEEMGHLCGEIGEWYGKAMHKGKCRGV
jgi:hypothetical protein